MGILDNDTVIVDAILTKLGRDKLRQGEPLGITQYAFGDTGVDYNLYKNDEKLNNENFEFSKIKQILDELKILFDKRGYQINWKDLNGQNVYQTLSALSMASPFSILEKQILLETKNIEDTKNKFEEILKTYNSEFSNLKTIQ